MPSPKSQYQFVGVPPVLVSVNSTVNGDLQEVTFEVKEALGFISILYTYFICVERNIIQQDQSFKLTKHVNPTTQIS